MTEHKQDPTCKIEKQWYGCETHVDCDEDCKALEEPKTFKEYKAAYEHWREHGSLSGCAHQR